MLMNDFFTFHDLQAGDHNLVCNVMFNKQHAIFKGHFPEQPVVPGVCMMQIVKELLQRHLNKTFLLRNTGQVKFLQLITPEVNPEINISWKESDQKYFVNAIFRKDADLFKFTGVYETK